MAAWVPPSKKSLAVAFIFSGFQVGTVCAYLASPIVMEHLGGWRGMFYLYGALGVAWLGPWLLLAKDAPPEVSFETTTPVEFSGGMTGQNVVRSGTTTTTTATRISKSSTCTIISNDDDDDEGELISGWDEGVSMLRSAPWHDFLTSRGAWAMTLAHAANNWGLYNSLSWTPTFYAEQYGLNVRESAFLSVLPSVAGAIGGLFAGTLADAIITKTSTSSSSSSSALSNNGSNDDAARTVVRKVFQGIALLGPAACLLTLAHDIPTEPLAAQALLTGTVGLQAFNAAGYGASAQEKAGQRWSGLLYSLTSLPGVIVGSVGVYATGQILDATHQDWSTVFGLNAAINIVGAMAFITLYDSKKEFD
jgi:ACS family sodium-dependent inorganic phosphate cotransporter